LERVYTLQHSDPKDIILCEYRVLAGAQTRWYRVLCGGI